MLSKLAALLEHNTRSNNITNGKLRALVDHASSRMIEHYTHFDTENFKDIQEIQNKIINFEKVG